MSHTIEALHSTMRTAAAHIRHIFKVNPPDEHDEGLLSYVVKILEEATTPRPALWLENMDGRLTDEEQAKLADAADVLAQVDHLDAASEAATLIPKALDYIKTLEMDISCILGVQSSTEVEKTMADDCAVAERNAEKFENLLKAIALTSDEEQKDEINHLISNKEKYSWEE